MREEGDGWEAAIPERLGHRRVGVYGALTDAVRAAEQADGDHCRNSLKWSSLEELLAMLRGVRP